MTTGFEVTGRIDVHSHYLPPGYRETATAALGGVPDGVLRMPAWDPESTIAVMDRQGIATAMLSVSSPGVHFGTMRRARSPAPSMNSRRETRRTIAVVSAPSQVCLCQMSMLH